MKLSITFCMGTACFAQGSVAVLAAAEEFVNDNNLSASFQLEGCRCTDQCARGPIVIINGTAYKQVTEDSIVEILQSMIRKQSA